MDSFIFMFLVLLVKNGWKILFKLFFGIFGLWFDMESLVKLLVCEFWMLMIWFLVGLFFIVLILFIIRFRMICWSWMWFLRIGIGFGVILLISLIFCLVVSGERNLIVFCVRLLRLSLFILKGVFFRRLCSFWMIFVVCWLLLRILFRILFSFMMLGFGDLRMVCVVFVFVRIDLSGWLILWVIEVDSLFVVEKWLMWVSLVICCCDCIFVNWCWWCLSNRIEISLVCIRRIVSVSVIC